MSNQDIEAQAAEATKATKVASGVGKAAVVSILLVAVPALIVGSVALSRTNAASAYQSQQVIDMSTAHHGGGGPGEGDGTTKKNKKSRDDDDIESKGGSSPPTTGTLDTVVSAGTLKCGVVPVVGFADNSTGTWVGMDIDLCRAVAAGVGVDVEFVQTTFPDRWIDLQSGRFDLLSAYSTHTMERDIYQDSAGKGFCFSDPYFYDGATYAGLPEAVACLDRLTDDSASIEETDCSTVKVCVEAGTTTIDAARRILKEGIIVEVSNLFAAYQALIDGKCSAVAGGRAEVAEPSAIKNGYSEDSYAVGTNLLLRDPLAMVARDDDRRWCDVVFWTQQALVSAEEQSVTQSTADDLSLTSVFGEEFDDIFVEMIRAVGNYGEVYARNVESIIPRAGLDTINNGETGRLYSLPFGDLSVQGDNPLDIPESTISKIHQRGYLSCGITRRASFAEFSAETLEFEGYDVDYCKAISAALFDGPIDNVVYVDLPATSRFEYLNDGIVDVLSRITTHTLERDVKEPTTGQGFSLTFPVFFDGLRFGGIPPHGQCADNLDTTSEGCENLRICVNAGTTTEQGVRSLFADEFVRVQPGGELSLMGLVTGECNVVAGGSHDVAVGSVQSVGYTEPYEVGANTFSKDPLAIMTPEDDPSFSDFCFWVLQATIFAEEKGITQATATDEMPLTNLYGDLFTRMLQNTVQAVGNTAELYERNIERLVPRAGLNQLNDDGGPQLYSLPGIASNSRVD